MVFNSIEELDAALRSAIAESLADVDEGEMDADAMMNIEAWYGSYYPHMYERTGQMYKLPESTKSELSLEYWFEPSNMSHQGDTSEVGIVSNANAGIHGYPRGVNAGGSLLWTDFYEKWGASGMLEDRVVAGIIARGFPLSGGGGRGGASYTSPSKGTKSARGKGGLRI